MNNPFAKKEVTYTETSVLLRYRLDDRGITQTMLVNLLGKNKSWVSQDLMRDTEKTIKKLWAFEPDVLKKLSEVLDWPIEAMFRKMNLTLPIPTQDKDGPRIPLYDSAFEFLAERHQSKTTTEKTITFGLDSLVLPHFNKLADLVWIRMAHGSKLLIEDCLEAICVPFTEIIAERISEKTMLLKHDMTLSLIEKDSSLTVLVATENYDERYCGHTVLRGFGGFNDPAPMLKAQLNNFKVHKYGVARLLIRSAYRGLGEHIFGKP
jgi:hypothetical protein